MRTLLIAAALIYIFGATEVSASVIHIDFSGGAESVRFVCNPSGGCGPNQNISSHFKLNLSFDSGPGDELITSPSLGHYLGDVDLPRDFRTGDYLRDCPPNRRSGCASQGSRTSR